MHCVVFAYMHAVNILGSRLFRGCFTEQRMVFLPKLVDWLLRRSWSSCWNKSAYQFCYML